MTKPVRRYRYLSRSARLVALCALLVSRGASAVPDERDPLSEGEGELRPFVARPTETRAERPELVVGAVLTARQGTREREARLEIRLEEGYARVTSSALVENGSRFPTELAIRFRLPSAHVVGARCAPACTARVVEEEGALLVETVPPLEAGRERRVSLEYALALERVAGRARLGLPARGADVRGAYPRVFVQGSSRFSDLRVNDAPVDASGVEVSPFARIRVSASAASSAITASRVDVEPGARVTLDLPSSSPSPTRIALLVDGSPSTLGATRNAILRALETLPTRLHPRSEVWLVVFGAQAELRMQRTRLDALDTHALVAGVGDAEGTSTRLDRALALVEAEVERVIVLGDGGLTESVDTTSPRVRRPTTYLLVGPRPPSAALRAFSQRHGVSILDARHEAALALEEQDLGPLGDRLVEASAPLHLVTIRERGRLREMLLAGRGTTLRFETRARTPRVFVDGRALALTRRDDPLLTRLPIPTRRQPSEPEAEGRDLPREILLEALRRQFIPPARLCLREDRRGRARHAIRAELVVRLEAREVSAIEVNGELDHRLRRCLGEALEQLVLPMTARPMRVTYPIHTLEAAEPEIVELTEETRDALEGAMGTRTDER